MKYCLGWAPQHGTESEQLLLHLGLQTDPNPSQQRGHVVKMLVLNFFDGFGVHDAFFYKDIYK